MIKHHSPKAFRSRPTTVALRVHPFPKGARTTSARERAEFSTETTILDSAGFMTLHVGEKIQGFFLSKTLNF